MMDLKREIKKRPKESIPKRPYIMGYYDEDEEVWIKMPVGTEIIGMGNIRGFLVILARQASKIRTLLKLEKIDVKLEVDIGNSRTEFNILIDKESKTTEFINGIIRKVRTSGIMKAEKDRIKFIKLTLTF